MINAPDERQLSSLLTRVDRSMFQRDAPDPPPLPLEHRKLHINTDWGRDAE